MEVQGKVCLVTGGTRGIGAATALALARRGADLAIVARHIEGDAAKVQQEIRTAGVRALAIAGDLGRASDCAACVRETADKLGGVDVLVHCAGGGVPGGLLEITPEAWLQAFDVHVHAVFHLCRAALPSMQRKKEGAVVLVSSVAGLRGVPFATAYQVAKGALPQFARAMAREFADDNIRVNCVAPGIIRTAFHANMTPEQKQYNLDHRIPLHREGTPQEVADLICDLVANDYITGETMTIDGGLTMRIA